MAENENKTISIPVDDFQYYTRRDERLSILEHLIIEQKNNDETYVDISILLNIIAAF